MVKWKWIRNETIAFVLEDETREKHMHARAHAHTQTHNFIMKLFKFYMVSIK